MPRMCCLRLGFNDNRDNIDNLNNFFECNRKQTPWDMHATNVLSRYWGGTCITNHFRRLNGSMTKIYGIIGEIRIQRKKITVSPPAGQCIENGFWLITAD